MVFFIDEQRSWRMSIRKCFFLLKASLTLLETMAQQRHFFITWNIGQCPKKSFTPCDRTSLYSEWNSLTISDISRTFSQTGFLVKLYKKIFQNRLGNLKSFVKYTFVHSVSPCCSDDESHSPGWAGQKEDARVAAGLPHHRPLRHRLLDLLHRPTRGGARYSNYHHGRLISENE